MAVLSPEQIFALARGVGLDVGQATTAVAVALAESGGNDQALNTANGDGSNDAGLWQINSVHKAKPDYGQRFEPGANARLMAAISGKGTSWSPWVTYTSGAYKEHLPAAQAAAKALGGDPANSDSVIATIGDAITNPVGAVGDLIGGARNVAGNLVADAVRALFPAQLVKQVLLVLAGAGLVLVGARMLGSDLLAGPVGGLVKKAASLHPAGAAVVGAVG